MNIREISHVVSELGEGPIWNSESESVIWTDITQKTIHTTDLSSGITKSVLSPIMIGAVALTNNGNLIAATQEGFAFIDSDGEISKIHSFLPPDMRMNDGKVDPAGRFWAGSLALDFESNRGSLYVLETDGSYKIVLSDITLSNGMGWSPDEKYFYFIDSIPGVLKRFDFNSRSGHIDNPIDLVVFDSTKGIPDGMCVSSDGKIIVALWDGSRIEIYEPSGNKYGEINLEVSRPTSCTFGGSNGDVLIVTSSGQGIDKERETLAGKTLAITGTGLSGQAGYRYG